MQINVDDEVFHKWALDRGYVRLTDISEFVRRMDEERPPTAEERAEVEKAFENMKMVPIETPFLQMVTSLEQPDDERPHHVPYHGPFAHEVAKLEQLDDLKPAISLKQVTDALRQVVSIRGVPAGKQLLADFGATKIGDVPESRRGEFFTAAEKLVQEDAA